MVYLFIPAIIILADIFSKKAVQRHVEAEQMKPLYKDKLYLWHRKNYGFPFGFLGDKPKAVKLMTVGILFISVLLYIAMIPVKGYKAAKLFYGVALGGACANVYDRVKNGCVTDFLYIKKKNAPVFNLADLFIFAGTVLSLISVIISNKAEN